MTTDRHVTRYADGMAILSGFQHDAMGGCGKEAAANDREHELMGLLARTPPQTPAGAAAMLRFWLAWLRSGDGSNVRDELDYLAMSNVAEFLEALPATAATAGTFTSARLRDLELRVRRLEMQAA